MIMSNDIMTMQLINKMIATPKEQWPKPNKRMGHPGIPKHIEDQVEKERKYRFEMIMDVPPFTFLAIVKNRGFPWQ
tara:strand:+ start:643 stop:870 length:228 start_codon:yes stop_codon:yes gene_type:complete